MNMTQAAQQLQDAGLPVFPCTHDKRPAVPRGVNWQDAAMTPANTQHWPSDVAGVPVPHGVVVLDLDTYKGVTRADVERHIGCTLDWDRAILQRTQRGGEHYAFRAPAWEVRQGSNIGLDGLDTRAAGRGYICTGEPGYSPIGFGVFKMACPDALPVLPDAAFAILGKPAPTTSALVPASSSTLSEVRDALRYISPACSRSEWIETGMALRNYCGEDDDGAGLALFDAWSSGALVSSGESPPNYNPDDITPQWFSITPGGKITAATLFHKAIQNGYRPSRIFDTAAAFGADAAGADVMTALVDRIEAHGSDPRHITEVLHAIESSPCNEAQRVTLLAVLQRQVREAGLLTKALRDAIDGRVGALPTVEGGYGKSDTRNAVTFLDTQYPNGTLRRAEQCWYGYNGKVWVQRTDDEMHKEMFNAMAASVPQATALNGAYTVLSRAAQYGAGGINEGCDGIIIFDNGVLDLDTGQISPHDPKYFTTHILPFNYNPVSTTPRWLAFLNEVFEGDVERVHLLQEWFGYMLTHTYEHHKILLMLGPPRSGKSTIGRVLQRLVGDDNFTGGGLSQFARDSFLDSLRTKTVVFSGDTEKKLAPASRHHVIENIKKISGSDAISFDRKYKSAVSCTLPSRITLAANHVPELFDDSGALAGRMLVLNFDISFKDREDHGLFGALRGELEGIAVWALHGLVRLRQRGAFKQPQAGVVEMEDLEDDYSPLRAFIKDACRFDGGSICTTGELYDAYRAWAVIESMSHIMPRRTFTSALKDALRGSGARYGVHRAGDKTMRGFRGLSLRQGVVGLTAAAFKPEVVR